VLRSLLLVGQLPILTQGRWYERESQSQYVQELEFDDEVGHVAEIDGAQWQGYQSHVRQLVVLELHVHARRNIVASLKLPHHHVPMEGLVEAMDDMQLMLMQQQRQ